MFSTILGFVGGKLNLIMITAMGTMILVGYLYYISSQSNIRQLEQNNAILKTSVEIQNSTINNLEKSLKNHKKEMNILNERFNEITEQVDILSNKFAKRDFGKLLLMKPKLMEKIINKATKALIESIEKISRPSTFDTPSSITAAI